MIELPYEIKIKVNLLISLPFCHFELQFLFQLNFDLPKGDFQSVFIPILKIEQVHFHLKKY